jgi:hypothetical protein
MYLHLKTGKSGEISPLALWCGVYDTVLKCDMIDAVLPRDVHVICRVNLIG